MEFPVLPTTGVVHRYRMGFFAFSNNNLAIRKACAVEIGSYDPAVATSEDVDICFRAARSPAWVTCRERDMAIRHKARRTLGGMLRQIWGWGINLGGPYAKTGTHGLFLHWVGSRARTITHHLEVEGGPLLVCVFVTDFHVANALALTALIAAALGASGAALLAAAFAGIFAWRALGDVREAGLAPLATAKLAVVHWIANLTFTTAAFVGALRRGIVLVPASILAPRRPAP